jgi:hypothetical protein
MAIIKTTNDNTVEDGGWGWEGREPLSALVRNVN